MSVRDFHRRFDTLGKGDRFAMIETPLEPTSLFVIFQQLREVRAQKKYFEDRETRLLYLAEIGFNQLDKKDDKSETT